MKKRGLLLTPLIALAFAYSCAQVDLFGLDPDNFVQGGSSGNNNLLCKDVDSDFSTDILPMLQQKCGTSGCHASGEYTGGITFYANNDFGPSSASAIIGEWKKLDKGKGIMVNTGTPVASKILQVPLAESSGGLSHGGGDVFGSTSDPDYLKLRCWIENGAKNDLTNSTCSFGEYIYPITQIRTCAVSCHAGTFNEADVEPGDPFSAGNLSLGVGAGNLASTADLLFEIRDEQTTRVNLNSAVTSLILTKPLGVEHGGGQIFSNTNEADYQKILCWIEEGALNN